MRGRVRGRARKGCVWPVKSIDGRAGSAWEEVRELEALGWSSLLLLWVVDEESVWGASGTDRADLRE